MEELNKQRLVTLAKYLETMDDAELSPGTIIMGRKMEDGTCPEITFSDYGQWLPYGEIYPGGDWSRNHNKLWVLNESVTMPLPTCFCVMYYLCIKDIWLYMHLFTPCMQNVKRYSGRVLQHDGMTPKNIAGNIRALLQRQRKGR